MAKSIILKRIKNLLLVALSGTAVSAWATPENYFYRPGLWQFSYLNSYYQATGNYRKTGSAVDSLQSGHSYFNDSNDFEARWVPLKRWGFRVGVRANYAQSKEPTLTRTNSTLTHIKMGADFLLAKFDTFHFISDLTTIVPLKRIDPNDDVVLTGEGALEITPRLRAQGRWGNLHPWAWVGYSYRDEGRASLLPFSLGTEYQWDKSYFGIEGVGHQYVTQDKYTSDPSQRQIVILKTGNALVYEAVNSSLFEIQGWWRWAPNYDFEFIAGGGQSVTGSNIAAGMRIFAGLIYRFKTEVNSPVKKQQQTKPSLSPDLFEEETNDGVDQKLFESP